MKEEKNEIIEEPVKIEKNDEVKEETETVVEATKNEGKGLSVASLVLGIVSVVFFANWFLSIVCGVLAIIFGVMGKKRAGKGMAKAGFILGIIGIGLWVLIVVLFRALIGLGTAAIFYAI